MLCLIYFIQYFAHTRTPPIGWFKSFIFPDFCLAVIGFAPVNCKALLWVLGKYDPSRGHATPCHPPPWLLPWDTGNILIFTGQPMWLAPQIYKSYAIWVSINKTRTFVLVYLHNTMCFSIYGTGYVHEMQCAGLLLKFVVHDTPTFTQNASFQPALMAEVGFLARPAGGAVEKNGQLVSPVIMV